jgi:hypothetical protein
MTELLKGWVLKPEYLPGWFQAFAALVALAISAWSVVWTGNITRQRNRQEIRGVAVAIYPEIEMLAEATRTVRGAMIDLKTRYSDLVGQSVGASFQTAANIGIPPMLDRNIDRLFILGDLAGPSCLQLVRFITQYNSTVEDMAQRIMIMNAEQWKEAVGHLEDHLRLLDQVIAKCEHEVRPIHDSVKG